MYIYIVNTCIYNLYIVNPKYIYLIIYKIIHSIVHFCSLLLLVCLKQRWRWDIKEIPPHHFISALGISCPDLGYMVKELAFALVLALRQHVSLRATHLPPALCVCPDGKCVALRQTCSLRTSTQAKASSFIIYPRSGHDIPRADIKWKGGISYIHFIDYKILFCSQVNLINMANVFAVVLVGLRNSLIYIT